LKTSPIEDVHQKVLSVLDYNPRNILGVAKLFSSQYPIEWSQIRKEKREEDISRPPLQSMQVLINILDDLEEENKISHEGVRTGNIINLSRTWKVSAVSHIEEIKLQIPKLLKRMYTQLSHAAKLDINTVIVNSLKQYVEQRILSTITVTDIIKVIVVDNFGTSPFTRDMILPFLKDRGIYSMVDISLDSYCINLCGSSGEDLFLQRLEDGRYRLNEK